MLCIWATLAWPTWIQQYSALTNNTFWQKLLADDALLLQPLKISPSCPLFSRLSWARSLFCRRTTSTPTASAGCPSTSRCTSASPCRCPWVWDSPRCLPSRPCTGGCRPTRPSHLLGWHLFSVCLASSRRTGWTRFVRLSSRPFLFL